MPVYSLVRDIVHFPTIFFSVASFGIYTGEKLPTQRVRLFGQANSTGLLQVNYNGVWGTVRRYYSDDWDDIDSEVACRQIFGPK